MTTPQRRTYPIWQYFTPDEQEAVLQGEFAQLGTRDAMGRCPLGRAMQCYGTNMPGQPAATQVASWLVLIGRVTDMTKRELVREMASQFITDWDDGDIRDLATAMGRVEEGA